jgi:spermidine/putrescine transport system permease protein
MSKRDKLFSIYLIPYVIFLSVFILLPMVFILMYSLLFKENSFVYKFTGDNFALFFQTNLYIKCIWKSLYLAFFATIVCLLVSYPLAYFIARRKKKYRKALILLVTSPMWINMLLRTLAIKQLLDGPLLKFIQTFNPNVNVIIGNDSSVIFGMVYNYIPYMILPIYTSLTKIDYRLSEASTDLGARGHQTFKNVILPLSMPGVFSGITIVFLSCTTTITISKYLGEGRYFLIGNLIENEFITNSRWGFGSAISLIMLVLMMIIMFIFDKLSRKWEVRQ